MSFYEEVGGEKTFRTIVHAFYSEVPSDDILGPMYPADDLSGAEDRLVWFLSQYWGGPHTYQENRGNPMLRRRHFPFPIDRAAADRWLDVMGRAMASIDSSTLDDAHRTAMWNHMERVAAMMINKA